jgi:pyruvate/2-oxoglutarate dehydrogenase complex dihydrolipoamide dehydrogenase (E3) component
MRRLRAAISPHDSAARFRDLGVHVFLGEGRFTGPDSVRTGDAELRFRKACIATGTRPRVPRIPGLAEAGYRTNETIFSRTELPRRLAVLGSGPIGCEMAQAFARFGSGVHLFEVESRLLAREDPEASRILHEAFGRDGIDIHLEATVERVSVAPTGRTLHFQREGVPRRIEVDEILVAVGRVPGIESLDLERAGVEHDPRRGILVDDRLRTSNRRIYAAGDVASPYRFTHAADFLARIVVRNALFFGRAKASSLTLPWCTYTDPEVAHVGLYEREARERGIETSVFVQELADVDRAVLDGEDAGFVKLLVARGSDRILGATIVASHAGDLVAELTTAIRRGIGLASLAETIHPYPTQGEAIRKLGDAYNRTRLTPRRKRLLERYFAWTR